MTFGQHIQELRRAVNLTQEGLGEALGVSRQAVSKWEADAALPEVETLIAMSRIFGVTVGELLQVEAPAGEEPRGELSDRELAAVESIVRRYVEEMEAHRPAPQKPRRWPAVLLALCALLLSGWVLLRIENLASRFYNLQINFNNLSSFVQNEVNNITDSITGQVTDILESQNSLTTDYGSTVTAIDIAENTVTVEVWAVPKTWQEGMEVSFFAASGGTSVTTSGVEGEGHRFTATLTLPLSDELTVDAHFILNGVTQTQRVGQWGSLRYETYPDVSAHHSFHTLSLTSPTGKEPFTLSARASEVSFTVRSSARPDSFRHLTGDDPVVTEVKAAFFRNQELVQWLQTAAGSDAVLPNAHGTGSFSSAEVSVPMEEGDTFTAAVLVTDSYGRTWLVPAVALTVRDGELVNTGDLSVVFDLTDWTF